MPDITWDSTKHWDSSKHLQCEEDRRRKPEPEVDREWHSDYWHAPPSPIPYDPNGS